MKSSIFSLLFCLFIVLSACTSGNKTNSSHSETEVSTRLSDDSRDEEIFDDYQPENDLYYNNSLSTGDTPYATYYGKNAKCSGNNCSQITVRTSNSDVLVTIKQEGQVVRHAYIQENSSYTFYVPDGTYQPFFYYGKGWNPEKEMKSSIGTILGGFVSGEVFGKDYPQHLESNILEYSLILQQDGNFSTKPSNPEEAL